MKLFSTVFILAASQFLFAVGEKAPNLCWNDQQEQKLCLEDYQDQVRVLLYNGGFCGPCNEEFAELVPQVGKFAGKPVQFLSLSVAGWTSTGKPTAQFLKEWKTKHTIPFPVLASSRQELYGFIPNAKLPSIVIVDQKGIVALAEINPGVDAAFAKIEELLR